MAVISVNSISGINSITAQSNTLNFYDSAGGTLSIGASVSGNITGNVTGNLTGNVNSSGVSTFSGGIVVAAGSVSAPSISPSGDSNTGIFFPDGDTVSIGEGGTEVIRVHSLGRVLVGTANTNIAGAPSNKGAKQFIYTAEGNGEWALQARHDSTTGNGLFVRAGNNSTTYTARFTGYDENNVHLNIDGLGRVTTPLQPAFLAYSTGVTVNGGWNNLSSSLTAEAYDIGGNYGTSTAGRFVAPVAGRYLFYFGGWAGANSSSTRYAVSATVNGGGLNYISGGNYSANDSPLSGYLVVYNLSANDYVELYYYSSILTQWGGNPHWVYWGGYLL